MGMEGLNCLQEQEISGRYRHFIRMLSIDFEYLMNLIGANISKKYNISGKPFLCKKDLTRYDFWQLVNPIKVCSTFLKCQNVLLDRLFPKYAKQLWQH
ncbi:unnamed protein product [Macrosiphum euphorbiae]|uniref:Uncharacterized protein n=1 Tax=Macrosiphum euphorbiae TaxID=13131 RepID=A0AAV0WLG1_9HEMI|nr:unnamed protein product [Macrosiphum euphorbiae]